MSLNKVRFIFDPDKDELSLSIDNQNPTALEKDWVRELCQKNLPEIEDFFEAEIKPILNGSEQIEAKIFAQEFNRFRIYLADVTE